MSGPKVYGAALGTLVGLVTTMPNPMAPSLFYGLLSMQLGLGAVVVWRRMGYPYFTLALSLGALGCAMIAGLCTLGWRFPFIPLGWNLALVAVGIGAVACYHIEAKRRGDEWKRWRDGIKGCSALDIFLLRHIPNVKHPEGRIAI